MPRSTPISDVMTKHVLAVGVDAKLSEVRQLLTGEDIHHVPVVEGRRPVGIISSRDLVQLVREAGASQAGLGIDDLLDRAGNLSEVMTRDLVTMRSDEAVDRAIDLIADGSIHSVLVVDLDHRLVGIVTDTDLLDYLCS